MSVLRLSRRFTVLHKVIGILHKLWRNGDHICLFETSEAKDFTTTLLQTIPSSPLTFGIAFRWNIPTDRKSTVRQSVEKALARKAIIQSPSFLTDDAPTFAFSRLLLQPKEKERSGQKSFHFHRNPPRFE